MSNADFNDDTNKLRKNAGSQKLKRSNQKTTMNEKNVNWPGVPGKTQGKDRSGGVKKAKIHPVSKGL